jgi:hypothetical protein
MAVDIIDFFKQDGYSMLSLTQLMQKVPYNPGRIQALFTDEPIGTPTALIEITDGVVSVLPTSARGSSTATSSAREGQHRVTFEVPHIETSDGVSADSLFGYREFGSNEAASPDRAIAKKMAQQKANITQTWEWHAAAAVFGGIVYDADGNTVLVNLNTKFGITRSSVAMHLDTTTTDVRGKCVAASRVVRDALKGVPHSGLTAFCGRNFWDSLISHTTVVDTFKYQEGAALRANMDMQRFSYGGINFELYDTGLAASQFLSTDKAYVVPEGVPDNYQRILAPSDRMEGGVGTLGVPLYNWQQVMEDQKGIKMTSQTNPAYVVRRGEAIVELDKIS